MEENAFIVRFARPENSKVEITENSYKCTGSHPARVER